jgi:hypothetical protein
MTIESGTFARATTGSVTYLYNDPTFVPSMITFYVSGKVSGDTENHFAVGYWHGGTDGTLQASAGRSSSTRLKTLSHYAGTVEKIAFTVTGVAPGEFTLNYTAADVNYNIHQVSMA